MRVLCRTLTEKSVLGFGYESVRDLSVRQIIDLGRFKYLVSSYYGLDKINFTDDVLNEIGITEEMRIEKPSKLDYGDLYYSLIKKAGNNYYSKYTEEQRMGFYMKGRKTSRSNSQGKVAVISWSNFKKNNKGRNQK